MKRRILLKVLIILLALVITVSNFSYASDVTLEQLKSSIEKVFTKDIVAKDKEGGTETWTAYDDAIITDSKITLDEDIQIDYSLENNIAKFKLNFDAGDEVTAFFAVIGIYEAMERYYLAAADTLGIDKSLAYTHFNQQIPEDLEDEEELENIYNTNDIFKLSIEFNEIQDFYQLASKLEIDLDKLATLDDSKIDKSKEVYTITLQEPSADNDEDGEEIELTNKQLKEELKNVFSKDINAVEQENDGAVTETDLSLSDSKIKIDDSNINIDGKDIIKYESYGTGCTFDIDYTAKDEDEVSLIAFEQFELMMRCYLASAKAIDADISLAYTDFQQVIDKLLENLEEIPNGTLYEPNDRFYYTLDIYQNVDNTYSIKAHLQVDLNKLSKLTKDKIDPSATMYKVTLENPSNESDTTDKDDTTVKGEIPYTGASYTVIIAIVSILVVGLISKAKYNNLKDIK